MDSPAFVQLQTRLKERPARWLVTGGAGFIGSNLVETLLRLGQHVCVLDNFVSGHKHNLDDVRRIAGDAAWTRFRLIEGDITDPAACAQACAGAAYVLHQAALGSVPRSMEDPLRAHRNNVDGFVQMLLAAREAKVKRFVYASSSAVYGDAPEMPKVEERLGPPLSPYALTKRVNELYADTFARCYGLETVGLRYFNVFGRRQDPNGDYAAVIPKWAGALLSGQGCTIFGDGETSRDFCYVENVVQANLLAATTENPAALNQAYNVACGARTTLNELFTAVRDGLAVRRPALREVKPGYRPFRAGDIRHSLADIGKARRLLGYQPTHTLQEGMAETLAWYVSQA